MTTLLRAGTAVVVGLFFVLGAMHDMARSGERPQPAASADKAVCRRSDFGVVLDVGHTAEVPGAISARGDTEYAFNLRLGQDIQNALADAGFGKTVLVITSTAAPLGLFERAFVANKMRADLFISIHHDSVPDYLLATWTYNGQEYHYNDAYPGYAIFMSNENADRAGSLAFGRILGKALQARGLPYTPHYTLPLMRHRRRELVDAIAGVYRYDALAVLQKTRMPAVLLEAGSIVNRSEELQLASPERRALISAALTAAVDDFCTARAVQRHDRLMTRALAPAMHAKRGPPDILRFGR